MTNVLLEKTSLQNSAFTPGKQLPRRLFSIDVFRALTMFFMIFVNDVSGVSNIPAWIGHTAANDDGMGFADTIFPLFLFIVGLSLPFALMKHISRGDSFYKVAIYILSRSIALLVMGFFHVNLENYSSAAVLPKAVWGLLITIGFFLIWLDYSDTMKKSKKYIFKGLGILILLTMAYLFKGGEPSAPVGLKPYWWGILGLIGWAYLICASLFLISKGNLMVQVIALIVFLLTNIAYHTGVFKHSLIGFGDASAISLTMAGVVTSLLYKHLAGKGKDKLLWTLFAVAGIAMIIFGLWIRPHAGGISKIHSTPAWVAICIGIGILVFELMMYLVDIKGRQNWFKSIKPAGTSTLTAYLIPYVLFSLMMMVGFQYPHFLSQGVGGILRSFFIAFFVIWITGMFEKRKIRLQL